MATSLHSLALQALDIAADATPDAGGGLRPADRRRLRNLVSTFAEDSHGHAHAGKGTGGGQFVAKGGSGAGGGTNAVDAVLGDLPRTPGHRAAAKRALKVLRDKGLAKLHSLAHLLIKADVIPIASDFAREALLKGAGASNPLQGVPLQDVATIATKALAWAWTKLKKKLMGKGQTNLAEVPGLGDETSAAVGEVFGLLAEMMGQPGLPRPGKEQIAGALENRQTTEGEEFAEGEGDPKERFFLADPDEILLDPPESKSFAEPARETDAHDGKRPGEFAPKKGAGSSHPADDVVRTSGWNSAHAHELPEPLTEHVGIGETAFARASGRTGTLDAPTKKAVDVYTGGGYRQMNKALREGRSAAPAVQKHIDNLRALFARTKPLDKPLMAWRGMKLKTNKARAELLDKINLALKTGQTIHVNGFTSTSLDPAQAAGFADGNDPVFEIAVRKGVSLQGVSRLPEEREVLLDHGTKFRVIGVKDVPFKHSSGVGTRQVIQLEQVVDDAETPAKLAEWQESDHNRNAGKFARKGAMRESGKHLARAGRLWHQRTPLDHDHPAHAGLHAAVLDADNADTGSSKRDVRWRLAALGTLKDRLQGQIGQHPAQADATLRAMLPHLEAAHAALSPHDPGEGHDDWDVPPGTPWAGHAEDVVSIYTQPVKRLFVRR